MLLIYPPVVKPCEPPAGIAKLCGALNAHQVRYRVLDANLEGLLSMLKTSPPSSDTWTRRAARHLSRHLASLNCGDAYQDEDRYRRAVKDLDRLLDMAANPCCGRLGLANYQHKELFPARSADLLRAAEKPKDNPFYPYFKKRLTDDLKSEPPSIIGLSLNYLSQALCAFAMIGFLRREFPGVKLVLGGGLVTSWMRKPRWRDPFKSLVDHLVAGPGEAPLLSLMGVTQSEDNHVIPNYNSLPVRDYFAPGLILPYSSSSGCYWNKCSFCPERAEGNSYHAIPAGKATDDLLRLVHKHKPVLIHFLDNAISPPLMKAICERPPGAPWYGFARITRHLIDPNFCLALRRSGCVMLKLGLESGDQAVLDSMQKGIHLEEASLALRNLRKAGISTYVYLLFGTPQEGLAEARKTLEFVVRHRDDIGFLNLAIFNMPIYGPEVQQMQTKTFYEGDLSLYTSFDHPKGWSRQLIRQFLDKEFRRHPAIAPILRRDPPVFTSNHAPFFVMNKDVRRRGLSKRSGAGETAKGRWGDAGVGEHGDAETRRH
jgi:radical SAM superfamily enzyme YgiQ (UPF0313 family)